MVVCLLPVTYGHEIYCWRKRSGPVGPNLRMFVGRCILWFYRCYLVVNSGNRELHVSLPFYSVRNTRIASAVLAPSVCLSVRPSVTRWYCVKTTARSTIQFSPMEVHKWPLPRMRSENVAKNCPKCCQIAKI